MTHDPMFIAALFTIARTWEQPRCPSTDEWKRSCGMYIYIIYIHTHTQWNISHKKKQI